jgi:hypothetical protein
VSQDWSILNLKAATMLHNSCFKVAYLSIISMKFRVPRSCALG